MCRSSFLVFFFLCGMGLLAQSSILNKSIPVESGRYTGPEMINLLRSEGIELSYSVAGLEDTPILLQQKSYSVDDLLRMYFDAEAYRFIERKQKILVVPEGEAVITISGYVEDAQSQERLIGANISLPELGLGATSNRYGFYSISIDSEADSLGMLVSYIGYESRRLQLSAHRDHRINIGLNTEQQELAEATVLDENLRISLPQMSQVKLSPQEIKAIPAFFGEADILKSIQLLPGVQSGNEGNINYIVRGGGPDQNLILLDGVPVYNASHLFGFFSVFNVDAIKNVDFTKGGFPARFGGRLSSVLEIDMKEGDMEEFHGAGSIGLLASKLTLEGPIVKNKASFMLSGRRTYFDLLFRPFLGSSTDVGYFFDDLNAKVNYKFSAKDRLYASYYSGRDKVFSYESNTGGSYDAYMNYGNRTAALRWNHLFSKKLFSNLSLTYTRYKLGIGARSETATNYDATDYFSRIEDYGLKYETDYALSPEHYLRMGASYTYHIFTPGAIQFDEGSPEGILDSVLSISRSTYSNDAYLFVEDDWKISQRWRVNAGLHYSAYLVNDAFYHSLQPRIAGRYLINEDWSLKASYSYMQQYVHLLTNSGAGLPTDLWVSSTGEVPPQKSHQWALGTTKNLWDGRYEFTSEVYYKHMRDLIAFREGTLFTSSIKWQDQVATKGIGNSYGWEFFLRKKKGATTGWIAYSLARAVRQFEELNDGEAFPYKYDRRHDLKLVLSHNFSERFNMGFAFLLNSGIRATVPSAVFADVTGAQQILYTERNAYEYPAYHRLDVSFNWTKQKKWGERTWTLGLYNAYSRRNLYFIYFRENSNERSARGFTLFPVLPSFSYSFRF